MEYIKHDRQKGLVALAKEYGLSPDTVSKRVNKWGWDLERALTTPPRKQNKARDGFKVCPVCKKNKRIDEFKWHKRGKSGTYTYCNSCKSFAASNRKRVLEHYGGDPPKCELCGEGRYGALDLDHVDGSGGKERRTQTGAAIYGRVIKESYPPNFRVLCKNCNWLEFMRMNGWDGDSPQ